MTSDLNLINQAQPKVSVLMITYNHEQFIAQAIESALTQQADFEYEIIIGEDYSSDRTREIVLDYQARFPGVIRVLLSESNLGLHKNLEHTYRACRGKYINILEGDDYWISCNKLEKQAQFMDNHPECAMCGHSTNIIDEKGELPDRNFLPPGQKQFFDFDDILGNYIMHTSSVLFRKDLFDKFSDWFFKIQGFDITLFAVLATYGRIGYLDEVMSVYRTHSGGILSPTNYRHRFLIIISYFNALYDYLRPEYKVEIFQKLSKFFQISADTYLSNEFPKGLSIPVLEQGADEFLKSLLNNLNFNQTQKAQLKNKYQSGFYGFLGFKYFERQEMKAASNNMILALNYDRSWLRNRGLWSILGATIFGPKKWDYLRSWLKFLKT